MNGHEEYRRHLSAELEAELNEFPAALIHGPRQCGKTTLARMFEGRGYGYINFDDAAELARARTDTKAFVQDLPPKVILDEVQRAPQIFTALKSAIDSDRRPGRFILTGSANVLLAPGLADSLAGRLALLRLHPLAQAELARRRPDFLPRFLTGELSRADGGRRLGAELAQRIVAGGFPAALKSSSRGASWYRRYARLLTERDVQDLLTRRTAGDLSILLEAAAAQTAQLFNMSRLASGMGVSVPTIKSYMALLSGVFLTESLPHWHWHRLRRLIKTPKLHIADTGLACALLRLNAGQLRENRALLGQLTETFVYLELARQASWLGDEVSFYHYRAKNGAEVDVVMEADGRVFGAEIKAGLSIGAADFKGLRQLREDAGKRFGGGALLYDGERSMSFGEQLRAIPISRLWEPPLEK